jgi:hypothetical protein
MVKTEADTALILLATYAGAWYNKSNNSNESLNRGYPGFNILQ